MADETLEPTLDDLRRLNASAEAGAWWVDYMKVEGGRGPYYAYAIANPMGKHIADTMNGDLQVEHEEDGVRRDIPGKDNLEFAAACVNYVRNTLLKPLEKSTVARCWSVDEVDEVIASIRALVAEPVYEDGQKAKGISVKFLMRITLLEAAASLRAQDDPLVIEARAALLKASGEPQ